jgi:hypothetical protein
MGYGLFRVNCGAYKYNYRDSGFARMTPSRGVALQRWGAATATATAVQATATATATAGGYGDFAEAAAAAYGYRTKCDYGDGCGMRSGRVWLEIGLTRLLIEICLEAQSGCGGF